MKKITVSILLAILLAASVSVVRLVKTPTNILTWDVFGYYLYLPAKFIYNDPALKEQGWLNEIMNKYQPSPTLYQLVDINNGNRIIKYSTGLAVVYSPFFFIAHWLAPVLGYPADGFSLPYQIIIAIGGLIWTIAGIFLLRKLLIRFFDEKVTAALLLLIIAGTNYFHLASIDGTLLTHNFLFTLYAALLLLTIEWHENPTIFNAAGLGLTCGLISLIRPSEAICFLIPILWLIGTSEGRRTKLQLIKTYPWHILIAGLIALMLAFIQFSYWKSMVGEWIYYSYSNNPGEGFRFFPPFINEFLFSFRKGWFIYTPVMLFSVIGLLIMAFKYKTNLPAILTFILLDLWIISSWTAWWYGGGSFSSRSLVPAYVLLAIPLGYFIVTIIKLNWHRQLLIVGILLILLNLFQSWQFENGIIDKERMTKEYYSAIFGKTNIDKEALDELLLVDRGTETNEIPKHIERYKGREIFNTGIINATDTLNAIRLNGSNPYSIGLDIPYGELTSKDHAWIKSSMEIWVPESFKGNALPMLVNSFHYNGESYKYRSASYTGTDTLREAWLPVTYWYLTPEVRTKDDNLKIYAWNMDTSTVFVRNLRVEIFELPEH